MATFPIYQFYVELEGFKPKMWRRFQIMNDITLARLAYVLMVLFELRNRYSYEFRKDELEIFLKKHPEYARNPEMLEQLNREFKKVRYGITAIKNIYMYRTPEGYEELKNAEEIKIRDVICYENEEFFFYYDPEINWKIKIVLEKIFVDKNLFTKELPKVIDGNGYGIIENKAGCKDLEKFRSELKKSRWVNKTKYKNFCIVGENGRFYFDKFNVDDMNYRIKILPKALKDYYENGGELSNKQRRVLKRNYTNTMYAKK